MKKYKIIYWSILAGMLVLALVLELVNGLDGMCSDYKMTEFCLQYALILITLVAVYAALKMIRKNPLLRIAILGVPALASLICYHLFMNSSFGYLAVVCFFAYAFVYPAKVVEPQEQPQEAPNEEIEEPNQTESQD